MAPIPRTTRAIVIDKPGDPSALRYSTSHPVPIPSSSEALIQTRFSGINYIDTYFRSGLYPAPSLPLVLGYEGIGEILTLPKDNPHSLAVGDTVVWMHLGSYAEHVAVPVEKLVKVPGGIPAETALGSYLMGITALALTKESYEVKSGDTILVHAAAGGVGLLLCQLGRALGATVIGTASTKEKCDAALENGASHMINYKEKEDWVGEVMKLASEGVHCVYDGVGKTTFLSNFQVVRRKGHVISFGSASGPPAPLDIQLLGKKVTKITRAVVFQYIATREELEYYSGLLFEHLGKGTLKVKLHKVYELEDAKQAHEDLEGRATSGKSLLRTGKRGKAEL